MPNLIIPEGYCQTILTLAAPQYTDGTALVTLGIDRNIVELDVVAKAVADAWVAAMTARLDTTVRFESVVAYDQEQTHTESIGFVGAGPGPYPPPNTACLIEKRTLLRGVRNRGRMFFPSIVAEQEISPSGALGVAQLLAIEEDMQAFGADLIGSGIQPVILHTDGGVTPPGPPTPITSFTVDPVMATQRRRMRR